MLFSVNISPKISYDSTVPAPHSNVRYGRAAFVTVRINSSQYYIIVVGALHASTMKEYEAHLDYRTD